MKFARTLITSFVLILPILTSSTFADIVLSVSDDGTDLTYHYTGTMDMIAGHQFTNFDNLDRVFADGTIISVAGSSYRNNVGTILNAPGDAGTFANAQNSPSNGIGLGFGIRAGGELWWDQAYGDAAGTINVDRMWTIANRTVDTQFENGFLDNGPVVLWQHNTTGSTVTMVNANAVPEPSSIAILIGLGAVGFALRHRRRPQQS